MKLKKQTLSKLRWVQLIYGNRLHKHFVSHEEHFVPDVYDGDFAEPITILVCYAVPDKKVKRGLLRKSKAPSLHIDLGSVLIVKE